MYLKIREMCFLFPGYLLFFRKLLNTSISSPPTAFEKCEQSYEDSSLSDYLVERESYVFLPKDIKANVPVEMTSGLSCRWRAGFGWKQTECYLQTSEGTSRVVIIHGRMKFNYLRGVVAVKFPFSVCKLMS